jgi:hypothetical protein
MTKGREKNKLGSISENRMKEINVRKEQMNGRKRTRNLDTKGNNFSLNPDTTFALVFTQDGQI